MFCTKCGNKMEDNAKFCTSCGNSRDVVNNVSNVNVNNQNNVTKTNKVSIGNCIGTAILIAVIIFILPFILTVMLALLGINLTSSINAFFDFIQMVLPILIILFGPFIIYAIKSSKK